jgi:hypothetical protein
MVCNVMRMLFNCFALHIWNLEVQIYRSVEAIYCRTRFVGAHNLRYNYFDGFWHKVSRCNSWRVSSFFALNSNCYRRPLRLNFKTRKVLKIRSVAFKNPPINQHALVPCVTDQFSIDPLRSRKICAVTSALFAYILRPHNVPAYA